MVIALGETSAIRLSAGVNGDPVPVPLGVESLSKDFDSSLRLYGSRKIGEGYARYGRHVHFLVSAERNELTQSGTQESCSRISWRDGVDV